MPSKNVYGQSRLHRRGSIYYFRVRVPDDLIWTYDGKHEIKESLKTSDKREACCYALKIDQKLEVVRAKF